MNITKYLLLIFSSILLVINAFRTYIVIIGWKQLGRMPRFDDVHRAVKPVFMSPRTDEMFLFVMNFFTPLLMFILFLLFGRVLIKDSFRPWLIFPLCIFIFEFVLRCTSGYDYIMMH